MKRRVCPKAAQYTLQQRLSVIVMAIGKPYHYFYVVSLTCFINNISTMATGIIVRKNEILRKQYNFLKNIHIYIFPHSCMDLLNHMVCTVIQYYVPRHRNTTTSKYYMLRSRYRSPQLLRSKTRPSEWCNVNRDSCVKRHLLHSLTA